MSSFAAAPVHAVVRKEAKNVLGVARGFGDKVAETMSKLPNTMAYPIPNSVLCWFQMKSRAARPGLEVKSMGRGSERQLWRR